MKHYHFLTYILIVLCGRLLAAVPQQVNYQGRLTTAAGAPVPNGNHVVVFSIFDAASGGTALWTETQVVTSTDGLFSALLGSTTPLVDTVFNSATRYLGVRVGTDPELTPRTIFASMPYAHRVATVDGASGGEISGMVHVSGVNEALRIQGPGVGGANAAWISFQDATGNELGYVGDGGNTDQDMYLQSRFGNVHLYTSYGPLLTASAWGSVGIGTTDPASDRKLDVWTAGTTAIFGRSSAQTGNGVLGFATGQFGYGIWGSATGGSSQAGHFFGDVSVNGTLSKSAGQFRIDHPLDPANKYLNHSFVESPDMKNIYDGIVTLDPKGEAVVKLPDWFGALNRDFRYQLTCVGGYAPVYIAEGVRDNAFRIAGGISNLEVSWQVTGIRQDAYANAHRIPVEEIKADIERGYYLAPEELGHPPEKHVDWARRPGLMKELQDARTIEREKR